MSTPRTVGFPERMAALVDSVGSASKTARILGYSEGAVRKWLRGESEPNVTAIRMLCAATGFSIAWLVAGTGPRQAALAEQYETVL